jgi:hypothetical protein
MSPASSRHRAVAVTVLAVGLLGAACGGSEAPKGSKAFCLAADRYDNELERQRRRGTVDLERQTERVAEIARTAPRAIRAAAQRFLDAMEQVGSDPAVRDDPRVRQSVDAVNRYANQACSVYERDSAF